MKRLSRILFALALAVLLCTQALAAGSAELVRTFVAGDTLYVYVTMDAAGQPITQAEARVGSQSFPAAGKLETVQQAGFPVTYFLLVDNSTSMPAFREELVSFAGQLAQSGGENTRFLLATFGDDLAVVNEDVPGEQLAAEMEKLPFDERVTRLHSCIGRALDYLEEFPRTGNELRCAVILSDAVQYDPAGGVSYEELLERLSGSDVMLHSVGVGQDQEALEALGRLAEASGGTHQTAAGQDQAAAAAAQLAATNGAMLVTGFDLSGCTASGAGQAVSVTFASNGSLVCRAESTVDLPESGAAEPSGAAPVVPPADHAATSPSAAAAASQQVPLLPLLGGGALVVAAVAALCLLLRRKRKAPAPPSGQDEGIYMRVEMVAGTLAGSEELLLAQQLFVGRDPSCNIVFDDPSVSRRHARVFLADGTVYLEDLGSQNGTRVNGCAIQMPCALRSGDELAAGEVVWKLKF